MADRARCDLPYGHFGRGVYSLDDHSWHFERGLSPAHTTQQLGEIQILSDPLQNFIDSDRAADRGGPPSTTHRKQIKALADSIPSLRPASNLLSPLLRVSEAAQDALRRHDALKGHQIAFGDIQSYSRHRAVPVAAYVTGKTGCDLCITEIQKQKRGWDDDRRSWLEVPTLHGEQVVWSSHAGPIQQVQFASDLRSRAALLAVRLLTKTTIIRAGHLRTPSEDSLGSGLSLNTLHDVNFQQTGGHAHADVAFNPWFPQQVAVVDIAGKWTVLEFSARNMGQIARKWSSRSLKPVTEPASFVSDGWARLAWVLNPGTLAVCTRESLTLFSVVDDDPAVVEEVALGLSGAVPWILDFLVLPGRRDHLCVLTTTHILIFSLADKPASRKMAIVRFRIRHYKNPEDLSMRLSAWAEDNQDGVGILLYSRLPVATLCYRFKLSEAHAAITAEGIDIPLPITLNSALQPASIVGIEVRVVEIAQKPGRHASEQRFGSTRFFSALVAHEGLVVCQTLFSVGSDAAIPPLTWKAKLLTSTFKLSRSPFVVEGSQVDIDDSARTRLEPSARRSRLAKSRPQPSERTINLEQVADILQSPIGSTELFEDVLSDIRAKLVQPDLDIVAPMRTLHSFVRAELDVENVEESSVALAQLLQSSNDRREASPGPSQDVAEHGQHLTLAPVELPLSLELESLHLGSDMSSVYDRILAEWVTPLPPAVSGRIRLAKAKLCAQIAAQISLASQAIRIDAPLGIDQPEEQTQTQSQTQSQGPRLHEPQVPNQQLGAYPEFASSQLESSQPFPSSALPTPSQTPSITTASSHPSTWAAPERHRLSKYTSFSKPAPPALPRSLQNVLSHWQIGEDINDYDWMSTSRKIARRDADADGEMTEAERRRAQRRAERHLRRQRKEAAASQALQIASSQAPAILSASQPPGLRVDSQPSGVAGSSQAPGHGFGITAVSQVEAGRFGGRSAVVAGKKRRRQGF